jgi:hypothetical protein
MIITPAHLELVDHQWDHAIADDDYLEKARSGQ